jgi:hypothetical protein
LREVRIVRRSNEGLREHVEALFDWQRHCEARQLFQFLRVHLSPSLRRAPDPLHEHRLVHDRSSLFGAG